MDLKNCNAVANDAALLVDSGRLMGDPITTHRGMGYSISNGAKT